MSPMKRKAHFRRLSTESMKKFRLDPSPEPGDSTIAVYHERTQTQMSEDRDKLHIQIPFGAEQAEIQDLEPEFEKLEAKLEETEELDARYRPKIRELQDSSLGHRLNIRLLLDSRLIVFIADALIDLARLVAKTYNPETSDDPSTTRLQQVAANTTDAQLEDLNVPRKYWASLRKLDRYGTARNQQALGTSVEFARVISMEPYREAHVFDQWKDLFPLLYGKSVEELAAGESDFERWLRGIM